MTQKLHNSKMRDSSAKLIFGDPVLCSQFLRKYVSIPLLKDVQPEDIEDVTERYVHMFTEERNSDVVKKVRIKNGEESFYLVSLIEHKSNVDYNVVMQILRYMVFIWEDYERERNREHEGISRTKGFRYPPVLPVLFYDGARNWTAPTSLHERVQSSDMLGKYIPDYQCILVQLKDYSNEELMEQKDELSIIMMLDKLKDVTELVELGQEADKKYLDEAVADTPDYLRKIMAQIVGAMLSRVNPREEQVAHFRNQIEEGHMGELFANFKRCDIQATERKARKEGMEEGIKKGMEKGIERGLERGLERGMTELICTLKELHVADETIKEQLVKRFGLSMEKAEKAVEEYMQP